jgi:hypothetical protein
MAWKQFSDGAFRLTEKEVEALVPEILGQYRQAMKSIDDQLKNMYSKILSTVDKSDYYNEMLKFNRLEKLLAQISKDYAAFSRKAGVLTGQTGQISASNAFYRKQYAVNWLAPIDFAVIPKDIIQMSVYGSADAYKRYKKSLEAIYGPASQYMPKYGTLSNLLKNHRVDEIAGINRAITQGLINGHGYKKTSSAVRDVIGRILKKDGVLHTSGAMASAMNIVRTESTRIMNDASLSNTEYARSEGVDIRRIWDATFDNRTRQVHGNLDDKAEDDNGMFHSQAGLVSGPGRFSSVKQNARCRCTTFESVNGSKPTIRRGRNPETGENEVFSYTDFSTWAKNNGLKVNKFGEIVS